VAVHVLGDQDVFEDRSAAGTRLAEALNRTDVDPDVVLAIPRGGVPVGRAVADRLEQPLDVIVARTIGAPGNPDRALGAVAGEGNCWRNDRLIQRLDVPETQLEQRRQEALGRVQARRERYRGTDEPAPVEKQRVLVVSDGVETGARMIACLRQVEAGGAEQVVCGVPVATAGSLTRLDAECDDVVAVEIPSERTAIEQHYQSFKQIMADEVIELLSGETPPSS
jgi:predicted phosphoribosyltransferase